LYALAPLTNTPHLYIYLLFCLEPDQITQDGPGSAWSYVPGGKGGWVKAACGPHSPTGRLLSIHALEPSHVAELLRRPFRREGG